MVYITGYLYLRWWAFCGIYWPRSREADGTAEADASRIHVKGDYLPVIMW